MNRYALALCLCVTVRCSCLANAGADAHQTYRHYLEETWPICALSPDGKRLAYGMREGSDLILRVIDLETGRTSERKVGEDAPLPNDKDRIVRPARMPYLNWASNERIIYKPDWYRVFSISPDLPEPVELLVYRDQKQNLSVNSYFSARRTVRSILTNDPDYILIESSASMLEYTSTGVTTGDQYDFYRVNIHTGAAIPYHGSYGSDHDLYVDGNGVVRASVKKKARLKYELALADPATGELKPARTILGDEVCEQWGFEYTYGNGLKDFLSRPVILSFGYSPDWMFFASNRDRDTYAIYAVNLRSREVRGPILDDNRFDIVSPSSEFNYGVLLHSYITKSLASISTSFETDRQFWLEPVLQEAQAKIEAKLPNVSKRIFSWSDDFRRFLIQTRGGTTDWSVLLYDMETDAISVIKHGPEATSVTVPVWVSDADGRQILCYLTVPKSAKPGVPNKTIALFHGGPWSRDYMGPPNVVRLLADQGYMVLRVNFRGSTGLGKSHTLAAEKRFGDAALEDVETAIHWCIQNKLSDPDKIVAMGTSYGGYLALYASAMKPDLFRKTVAIAPVTDLIKIISEDRTDSEASWASYIFKREMIGDPKKDRKMLEAQSPIELVKAYRKPILLIHGEDDYTVPVTHSQNLFRSIKKLSKEHEFLSLKNAGHGGWSPEQFDEIYTRIVGFLD